MTHFSSDGRLITSGLDDQASLPGRRNNPNHNPNRHRHLPDPPDFRSYDPGRDRTRRNNERNRNDDWRARENRREAEKERDRSSFQTPGLDFYSPLGNHAAGYSRRQYDGGRGLGGGLGGGGGLSGGGGGDGDGDKEAPIYGHTLPMPQPLSHGRDYGNVPARHYDDYRARELRPKYEKPPGEAPPYSGNMHRFNERFNQENNKKSPYDWRAPFVTPRYDQTEAVAARNHGGRYGVLATRSGRTTARFRQRPMSWYFLIGGLLLLLLGLTNLLICSPNYYYCFLWMGPLSIVLGIVGLVHGGRYKRQCRNMYYVANGTVLVVAAMVASGLVMLEYIPLVKEIANVTNLTVYYQQVESRPQQPLIKTVAPSTRTWVCLASDSAGLVFVIGDYVALYAVILVAHKYWNHKYHVSKSVAPFCRPALFNPFMQLLWGELLVLVGIVSVFGCYGTQWHTYWSGVVAGLVTMVTGAVTSCAAKYPTKTSGGALSVLFNFFGIAACVLCIGVNILGIKQNIETLLTVGTGTGDHKDWLYASAVIFAFVLAMSLICFFYCMALLVRFSYYLTRAGYDRDSFTTSTRSDQTISTIRRYGYDKDRGFDSTSDPQLPFRSNPRGGMFGRWR